MLNNAARIEKSSCRLNTSLNEKKSKGKTILMKNVPEVQDINKKKGVFWCIKIHCLSTSCTSDTLIKIEWLKVFKLFYKRWGHHFVYFIKRYDVVKYLKGCLWKQRTKIEDSILFSISICNNVVCEASYASLHRLNRYSNFKVTRTGSLIPKEIRI